MQTHLLNVTINWPRSVIFVCHSTLFTLTAINVSLKTSGRSSVMQQYCHTIHIFLSVLTTFTGDKPLFDFYFNFILILFFVYNSRAVLSWSDFFMDWIPLRAHECRRQCEFTSACHTTLYSWYLCTGFIKYRKHLWSFWSNFKWKIWRRCDCFLWDCLTSGVFFLLSVQHRMRDTLEGFDNLVMICEIPWFVYCANISPVGFCKVGKMFGRDKKKHGHFALYNWQRNFFCALTLFYPGIIISKCMQY